MNKVIEIKNISKKYLIGHEKKESYLTLRDTITNKFKNLFAKKESSQPQEEFWALKDISFDVNEGDRIGIIGRNGAGKSTLLKVLSRITEPTEGIIKIKGRVASLLEVGTGFHPELTGRENIFLNGAILGMSKAEIKRKFDEIVAFSEIEKFLDTPVKRYSSGMYVRLAFAVAAHLEPEILVVDEVLAVGDAQFQKKCLGKMESVSREGRTILFVSHNMTALKSLCDRAILLENGRKVLEDDVNSVVNYYLSDSENNLTNRVWNDINTAPGNDEVKIHKASINIDNDDEVITVETPISIEIEYWNLKDNVELNVSIFLYNREGVLIFNSASSSDIYKKGLIKSACKIPGMFLNDENYSVRLFLVKDSTRVIYKFSNDILSFEVRESVRTGKWHGKWQGLIRPNLKWSLQSDITIV